MVPLWKAQAFPYRSPAAKIIYPVNGSVWLLISFGFSPGRLTRAHLAKRQALHFWSTIIVLEFFQSNAMKLHPALQCCRRKEHAMRKGKGCRILNRRI